MRKTILLGIPLMLMLSACDDPAKVARQNLIRAADNFEINRRITFINGITNQAMLVVEGYCSIEIRPTVLEVICKTGRGQFKRHHLGLATTVSYMSEQLDPQPASTFRYRVTFNPTVIIPDIRMNNQ